ncbi:potassium transporter Kup [Tessaracoccus aquimaris]|uniref:potassium transporter Kup n=1 Tax=Tessaracoccus aquimaris TaxID=1332264 RepID=UPI003AAFF1A2
MPPEPDKPRDGAKVPLAVGALGVVFGDIGTSPLYSLQTVFSLDHNAVEPTPADVYGVISLVFWVVTIIVTAKYVLLVMRADNDGEGGILALVALLRGRLRGRKKLVAVATILGIIGAGLFYGDSVITPAISVMSAFEGLDLVTPKAAEWVLPAAILVLTALFAVQRFGTSKVGRTFGPIMLVWFIVIAVLGVPHILDHPEILAAISPHHALFFAAERPLIAFIAMGAIVLCITGAEALYADMGHFGAGPIRLSWFAVVFPCLILNYFGQGAMILGDPATSASPFFHLAPEWARVPLVLLATAATVIASQSVISGAFSVSRQASRLRLLPRLNVRHTSKEESGQIYIASINWILFVGVLVLIAVFQSSERLATAYGLAVTGTLLLTTVLFLFTARFLWHWPAWKMLPVTILIGGVELVIFAANVTKIASGGWIPLLIAGIVIVVMLTWQVGWRARAQARAALEGPLDDFVQEIRTAKLNRVPGVAVFPHPDRETTPLALRDNLEFNNALHEKVIIVSIVNDTVPHVRHVDRVSVHDLGYDDDGIVHVSYRVGFNDSQDIPKALTWALGKSPELEFNPDEARYFLSILRVTASEQSKLPRFGRRLFLWLASNEASRTNVFHLPPERTVVMGAETLV